MLLTVRLLGFGQKVLRLKYCENAHARCITAAEGDLRMASGDELVKYITERVVTYIETPKEERRRNSRPKEPWAEKWFGMIPLGLTLMKREPGRKRKR